MAIRDVTTRTRDVVPRRSNPDRAMKGRLSLCVLILAAVCCSRPPTREFFVLSESAEYGDTYSFILDLSDSSATYGIDFFTRLEREAFGSFPSEDIMLDLRWFSPSDSILVDTAFVKVSDVLGTGYYSKDLSTPYKQSLDLPQAGEWRLKAKVVNGSEEIRGLGLILKETDGTR